MATETKKTTPASKKTGTKATTTTSTPSARKKKSVEKESLSASSVTVESEVETPEIQLTEEQIAAQKVALEEAIERGVAWFEEAQDAEAYEAMTEKEQTFSRLLDPMLWIMRESLITYTERENGCEECSGRVERDGNSLAVAVAEMMMGRM